MKPTYLICAAFAAAATMGTLSSCGDGAKVTAPAAAPTASVEQRAAAFPALALLPKDVTDFLTVSDIGGKLLSLADSGKVPGLTADQLPAEALGLDSIAIATTLSPGTHKLLLDKLGALGRFLGAAAPQLGRQRTGATDDSKVKKLFGELCASEADAKALKLPTLYVVITAKPGQEGILAPLYGQFKQGIRSISDPGVTPVNDVEGFCGARFDCAQAEELQNFTHDDELTRSYKQLLRGHSFSIMARQQGNSLVLAICEDAAALKLPAAPADSVLATDKLAACDDKLDKGMVLYSYISKELSSLPSQLLFGGVADMHTELASGFRGQGDDAGAKAAAAAETFGKLAAQLARPADKPSTLQLWCDKGLHLQASLDACGASYKPTMRSLAAVADNPATIFYAESAPMESGVALPGAGQLLTATLDLCKGLSPMLPLRNRRELEQGMAFQGFQPEIEALAAACGTIGEGLDGHVGLVLDTVFTTAPAFMPVPAGMKLELPRLALYSGVADRSKLSKGWDDLMALAGQVMAKVGGDPAMMENLPIVPATEGSTTSYTVSLPVFSPECVPSLALNDRHLALGTSSKLNTQMVESATGSGALAGSVFSLRLAPLNKAVLNWSVTVPGAGRELREAGQGLEFMSGIVERIDGSTGITDGTYTIRVDVSFK